MSTSALVGAVLSGAAPGEIALWLLVTLPAVIGVALCCGGRRTGRIAVPVSLTTAGVMVVLAFVVAFTRPSVGLRFVAGSPFALGVDGLSALVVPMIAVITLLVLIFAAAERTGPPARFHGLMLIFASAVAITATATTLPALLFAWELMGATSYALIGFHWREDRRVSSGLTAFLVTRAGDLGLYLAAGAALAGGAGLSLAGLDSATLPWRNLIAAGVLLAAFGKAAQLPFSFWLSRAMDGPSPVSALLHSAAMVAMGGYLLLRVVPLLAATAWAATTAAWVGAVTALLLGAVAVAQRDLKQLLAASTAAQLGFVVLAAGVGSVAGGAGQLVAHAATKALLFLVAGAWLAALGTKQLPALAGAARRWPLVGVTFAIGALSLAGVAPLSLWATKDDVLAGALKASPAFYIVGLAASALSAVYAGKALFILWRKHPANSETGRDSDNGYDTEHGFDTEQQGTRHIGGWEQVPLVVLAAGAALLGVIALPPVSGWVRAMVGTPTTVPAPGALEFVASAVLALVMLGLVMFGLIARKRVPHPSWAANWLGLEAAAHLVIVDPVLVLAERLARFDDRVLDRGVHLAARGTAQLASAASRADNHGIDGLVEAIARLIRRLGSIARRPQTGQLHQYYAQITVVLALALVFLLVVR